MSQAIEIEYKTLLTATEYEKLVADFSLSDTLFFTQTNVYYDTPDFKLKALGMGLRIRLLDDRGELTLKSPLPELTTGLLETTDSLTHQQAVTLIQQETILLDGAVGTFLKEHQLDPNQLVLHGELKTKRGEIQLSPDALLVLDESWYHGQHDYELELEVSEVAEGKRVFQDLLNQYGIIFKPSENKISRALKAKAAQ